MIAHTSDTGMAAPDVKNGIEIWFIVLGALLAALGMIASINLLFATIATTYFVGALMFAGGIAQIIHAAGVRRLMRTALWALSGVLYLMAAGALLYDPLFAAAVLTFVLAAALAASGFVRAGFALLERPAGWGWVLVSGAFSIAAGVLILLGWPINSIWVLGLFLAIDLLIQGVTLMFLGFSIRAAAREG
ncbi:HdeD family acid-resistance protein [Novosphingobium album (ex Liu et al. 2023)]|uniref:HdeD family acid-resistance protein n=1 Tax=Novosphingobium album (ex Liu et al. 2023) TaxID=3031130 RepID=A0ABT5WUV4_9SPHN|nr:HdeD family acid-resistance protein [Novosphingobium album (ex Liu et al. 2023)]MDE8653679.1 HdeD family acid-resistance protein [Novosphingobium album (ex Liu et al. 2023)]